MEIFKIGFDAKRLFNNHTGLGNYSRTLVQNLIAAYPEVICFLYSPKIHPRYANADFLLSPNIELRQPTFSLSKALWRSFGVKKQIRTDQVQLFHGLSHELPFGIQKTGVPSIVTIHDLIFHRYPKHYSFFDRKMYDLKFGYAVRKADRVIAISEQTKADIISIYKLEPEKIDVIYQSCHPRFLRQKSDATIRRMLEKYKIPKEYMLYVGSLIERKNLMGILRAMAGLPREDRIPLVVVGKGDQYKKKAVAFLKRHQLSGEVFFTDVENEDMPALYQGASLFLYPSFYEGFGLPVLEALNSRVPVITSNVSCLPEAGGPDSMLIDPGDSEAIGEAIKAILTDQALAEKMILRGIEYARNFDSEILTSQLMMTYRRTLQES